MRARVRQDSRVWTVTAGGGQYFTRKQWVAVNPGTEDEILRCPYLETEADEVLAEVAEDEALQQIALDAVERVVEELRGEVPEEGTPVPQLAVTKQRRKR